MALIVVSLVQQLWSSRDFVYRVLFVKEAGGKVTDFAGNDWNLDSRDILASNGRDHEGLLEIIQGL